MDAEASRQLAAARLSVDEIVPGQLFVSGKRGAADLAALQQRGITHVVNCSNQLKEGALENYHDDTLEYYRLKLEDTPQCPLLPLLPAALEWVQEAIAGGGVVLAHCHAGSSRSGAFAVAFLMQTRGLTYGEALAAAREVRPAIAPNAGFRAHLRAFQQTVALQASSPPAAPLDPEEIAADAQEFADAAMIARMARGEEWGEWAGCKLASALPLLVICGPFADRLLVIPDGGYKDAIEEALQQGETDWREIEARLDMVDICVDERGGYEEGEPPPVVMPPPGR